MDMRKLHQFAEDYYRLYRDPDTTDRDVEMGFSEKCFDLGLEMDCGHAFIDHYSDDAFYDLKIFIRVVDEIDDAALLGSAIFSKWRFITHWAESSLLDDNYRKWFIIALRRLCEIT